MHIFKIRFLLYVFKFKSHLKRFLSKFERFSDNSTSKSSDTSTDLSLKVNYVAQSKSKKKVFFVFRGLHFIDFFVPVHQALDKLFPEQYQVFYVDFSRTLKRITNASEYERFRKDLDRRLSVHGISSICHFSIEEIRQIVNFPEPEIIVTTEGIRHENFSCSHRVFLPHGCVVKEEVIQKNIRYNHFFQPSKPPYTYKRFIEPGDKPFLIHQVGYPKIHLVDKNREKIFTNDKPVVIFAPSLDLDLLFRLIKKGILSIFMEMSHINFVIKLHPSFGSIRHYIIDLFRFVIKGYQHIHIDTLSNMQDIAFHSSIMITDFGGAGAEYRLSFGKRVIYLQLPRYFSSGTDLVFRDDFGDAIVPVQSLKPTIDSLVAKGDLSSEEIYRMRNAVLFNQDSGDRAAAKTIHTILNPY